MTTDQTAGALGADVVSTLWRLQQLIGDANAARGFHDEGDELRGKYLDGEIGSEAALRNYEMAKGGLIMTEGSEMIEELRNGRASTETYYSGGYDDAFSRLSDYDSLDHKGNARKPEGVPSELADIVIRCFDFADEAGISLPEMISEKLAYNATRGRMHGGKKI